MKHILIIDDEERIRSIYARLFKSNVSAFEVYEAGDAWEATDIMMRNKVDLILLDLKMPEIGGQEMYKVIREMDPRVDVIISSVYSVDRQQRMVPWARDYFDKSDGPLVLLDKVSHLLVE